MLVINLEMTGLTIRKRMVEAGLSVRDIQGVLGFGTPQAIYKWLHGKNLPTLDNFVILADLFGVSVDELIVTERK